MVTGLMDKIRNETAEEISAAVAAAVEDARRRHGIDDPEFSAIVCAGIGHALDDLGMLQDRAVRALAKMLLEKGGAT